ncbi:MAG: ferritin family protein [Deltaproteobacteria bacterium]|nr:ferritin family protein [Deltaproteobacteria bacterium]
MQLFDYAIQMEKDGELYYRELAEKSSDKGIAAILLRLADAEVGHRRLFEALKKRSRPELARDSVVSDVKNLFARMRDAKEDIRVDADQKALYEKAQEIESDSEKFYRENAAKTDDPSQRAILEQLADEEHIHYRVLEDLIEFITRPDPGAWLENAEWHHLDEY